MIAAAPSTVFPIVEKKPRLEGRAANRSLNRLMISSMIHAFPFLLFKNAWLFKPSF